MSARRVPRHRCPKNWSSLPTATVLGLRLSRTRPFGAYHSVCKAVEGGIGTLPDNGPLRSGCAAATAAVSAFPSGIALKVAAAAAPVTAASPLAHRSPMGAFSVAFAIKIGRGRLSISPVHSRGNRPHYFARGIDAILTTRILRQSYDSEILTSSSEPYLFIRSVAFPFVAKCCNQEGKAALAVAAAGNLSLMNGSG